MIETAVFAVLSTLVVCLLSAQIRTRSQEYEYRLQTNAASWEAYDDPFADLRYWGAY